MSGCLSNPSPSRRLLPYLNKRKPYAVVGLFVGLTSILLLFPLGLPTRLVVLNLSPSLPLGFYVAVDEEPAVGRLVEFRYRTKTALCGGYNRFILKPICARSGDHVDTTGDWLQVNEQRVAPIVTHDSQGRPLEVWRGSRVLNPGEFFVYSDRVLNSFDSRCFGPVRQADIVAVRKPLWVWGDAEAHNVDLQNSGFEQIKSDSIDKE